MSLIISHLREQLKAWLQILIDLADTSHIPTSVTVIRCAPDSDDVAFGEVVFIPFVDELVGASD